MEQQVPVYIGLKDRSGRQFEDKGTCGKLRPANPRPFGRELVKVHVMGYLQVPM